MGTAKPENVVDVVGRVFDQRLASGPGPAQGNLGIGDVSNPAGIAAPPKAKTARKARPKKAAKAAGKTGSGIARSAGIPKRTKRGLSILIEQSTGRVHVRHMDAGATFADEQEVLCFNALPAGAAGDGDAPVWIQIAKVGSFKGHPAGPFELTPAHFEAMVKNFQLDGAVAWDFDHASEGDPTEGAIPTTGAPAQGKILRLENRGAQGLYALTQWFDLAKSYIREGKYWGCSPSIRFNARHPNTGENIGARLTSVALTNKPFLRGMQRVTASDTGGDGASVRMGAYCYSSSEYMPVLRGALQCGALATVDECSDQLERLREHLDNAGGDPCAVIDGIDLGCIFKALREALGVGIATTIEALLDLVDELLEDARSRHMAALDDDEDSAEQGDLGESNRNSSDVYPANETNAGDTQAGATELGQRPEEPGTKTMATTETSITMSEHQAKVRELEIKLTDQERKLTGENATLQLSLKEATTARETAEAEVVRLTAEVAKRGEAEIVARVNEAFSTYEHKKNLTAADKKLMLLSARSDRAAFDECYPTVEPGKRHLMSNMTGGRNGERGQSSVQGGAGASSGAAATGAVPAGGGQSPEISERDAARRLAAETGMPIAEAQRTVRLRRAQQQQPRF